MSNEKAAGAGAVELPLIVTRGDGVPLPDQKAAARAFFDQCKPKSSDQPTKK